MNATAVLLSAILAGMALEAVVLLAVRARWGRGPPMRLLLPNLGAGAFLLLAALSAAEGLAWPATAACLLGALVCHVQDLWARWRL